MKVPFLDLKREYKNIKEEIEKSLFSVLAKGEYCYGKQTEKFEKNFAKLTGTKYCCGVNSGTQALMIALKSLGIGYGDEVILPALTFIATAEAVLNVGAKPILVDINPGTLNIDLDQVKKAISQKTKAIISVHLYGVCVDLKGLLKIAKQKKLFVIEDAAHAEGSLYNGKPAGSWGDVGCFSMYPAKSLGAYGNAGAIVTNKKSLAKKIRMVSNHGRGKDKSIHEIVGFTGTIDNLQATVLNIKLKYFKKRLKKKLLIVERYNQAFENLPLEKQKISNLCQSSFYVYTLITEKRDQLKDFLEKEGISIGIYYPMPLHFQPSLQFLGYQKGNFVQSEKIAKSILSLPLFPEMNKKEVDFVIKKVREFFS